MLECLQCAEEFEEPLWCSGKCRRAWLNAAKPWPIGYCAHCGKVFNAKGKPQQLFCSVQCSASAPPQPDDTPAECVVCESPSKRRSYFCANHRQTDLFLQEWLDGADGSTASGDLSSICRNWILANNEKCVGCEHSKWQNAWYSGPIPLEIDHIDGNPFDNRLQNLRTLCPTCHATTDTYKGKNRGKGRKLGGTNML